MSNRQSNIFFERRRVVLGLTSLLGTVMTSCSFGSLADPTPTTPGTATAQATTPGITPTSPPAPAQGTTLYVYKGHTNWVDVHSHTVTWSPDGKYIALATDQQQVQIWNVASQKLVYTYHEHTGPRTRDSLGS